jgi:hypothetical protein
VVNELIMQVVAASQNFRFLAEQSLWLAFDGATAELNVYKDPDGAISKVRKFSEHVAKELLASIGIRQDRPNFSGMIQDLARRGILPPDIRQLFDTVRSDGNASTHTHVGDSRKALELVTICFKLAVWWYERKTGTTVGHSFVPPPPEQAASLRDLLDKVDSRMAELESVFDAAVRLPQPRIRIGPATLDDEEWRGGLAVACGSVTYLIHDPVETARAVDRSWTIMRAQGHSMDARAENVWLCCLRIHSPSAEAERLAEGTAMQASLLASPHRHRALPQLACPHQNDGVHILATSMPGVTWSEKFSYGHPDPLVMQLALDVLAEVAGALSHLHRRGQAHRALDGESVLVVRGRRGALRDLGLAWWPKLPGEESPYVAPEQRSLARGRPGPPTDVFQLASLLQHTCTGFKPGAGAPIPLRSYLPAFPEPLDRLLGHALDPEPTQRPDMAALAAALRSGRMWLAAEASS